MSQSFPRLSARTRRFTLGVPRGFTISPDGGKVLFLRTRSGTDPVTCLWELDTETHVERLVVDPRTLDADDRDLPPEERARRERSREQAGGVVAYSTDATVTRAAFALSGGLHVTELPDGRTRRLETAGAVIDPRISPDGRRVAYVTGGALHVARPGLRRGPDPGRAGVPGGHLRAGGVHRRRGDGPDARPLVVAVERRAAGRAGRRDARPDLVHRRPGQPRPPARGPALSGGRHAQRRHRAVRAGPRRVPGRGAVRAGISRDRVLGLPRAVDRDAVARPEDDAPARRGSRDRESPRAGARGHRPGLGRHRGRRARPPRRRLAGLGGHRRRRPPPVRRRPRRHPAHAAGARRARRRPRQRAVQRERRPHRDPAVDLGRPLAAAGLHRVRRVHRADGRRRASCSASRASTVEGVGPPRCVRRDGMAMPDPLVRRAPRPRPARLARPFRPPRPGHRRGAALVARARLAPAAGPDGPVRRAARAARARPARRLPGRASGSPSRASPWSWPTGAAPRAGVPTLERAVLRRPGHARAGGPGGRPARAWPSSIPTTWT